MAREMEYGTMNLKINHCNAGLALGLWFCSSHSHKRAQARDEGRGYLPRMDVAL